MTHRTRRRWAGARGLTVGVAVAALALAGTSTATAAADPREGLAPNTVSGADATLTNIPDAAGKVAVNVDKLASLPKTAFATNPGNFNGGNINSDLAFFTRGSTRYSVVGNYAGYTIYDVTNGAAPVAVTAYNCPGSQNDVSVVGNLLFMSVEQTTARIDCGAPVAGQPNSAVFRGVRIFDITNLQAPMQLPGVQTCRGSHTHTVVTKPGVTDKLWIYVSGTSTQRIATQLAGCSNASSLVDPATSSFRIDVIEVPLAAPATAAVVSNPRIFSICGSSACESDYATQRTHPVYGTQRGALNWLNGGGPQPLYDTMNASTAPRAPGGQSVSQSSACHDITVYPEIGLAAGACQGDGILLDISNPVVPVRIDNVTDNNFAYWHSATFNNDGTKVIFTDEWGGGSGARCAPTYAVNVAPPGQPQVIEQRVTPKNWGANAIFDIVTDAAGTKTMQWRSYYKIPNNQTQHENCVAHNGSLVPVPGRDVMVQAWYQGGLSVFDFTDSANPTEIAFFDRGPVGTPRFSATTGLPLVDLGGFWSTYWSNGFIFGSEIRLGFDSFGLKPSAALSANELAAAKSVQVAETNVQHQRKLAWPAAFTTVRSVLDTATRDGALTAQQSAEVAKFVDRAEGFGARGKNSAQATLRAKAGQLTGPGQELLVSELLRLADSL